VDGKVAEQARSNRGDNCTDNKIAFQREFNSAQSPYPLSIAFLPPAHCVTFRSLCFAMAKHDSEGITGGFGKLSGSGCAA
jgi:hypothetical protein